MTYCQKVKKRDLVLSKSRLSHNQLATQSAFSYTRVGVNVTGHHNTYKPIGQCKDFLARIQEHCSSVDTRYVVSLYMTYTLTNKYKSGVLITYISSVKSRNDVEGRGIRSPVGCGWSHLSAHPGNWGLSGLHDKVHDLV